jgi:hypothetical protein
MTPVLISCLAGDVLAWICPHADEPREPIEDGEIIFCDVWISHLVRRRYPLAATRSRTVEKQLPVEFRA